MSWAIRASSFRQLTFIKPSGIESGITQKRFWVDKGMLPEDQCLPGVDGVLNFRNM
ncbi:MAG: hypothetical protein K2P38_12830 [Lachnospiraceae bacterium]|nr:hypothetical protein [Lachnospiraceae bacterium]